MDKYEFKLRSEEIDKLMEQQKYADAVRLADTIDWRRVKSASTLAKIAELYKLNKRFEECRDILELAYDRNPGNRNVVYALCEISLEFGDIVQAIEYFKEYAQLAPRDTGVYVLRYRIYEAQNVGFEEKIELLEELKKKDRIEEWEYELAYLYHRAGFATKCVEECDELILWFGEGPYVIKAMELKMLHEPLTPSQQEKYDRRNEEKIQVAAQAAMERNTGEIEMDDDFRVKTIDMSKFNTMNLQAELAENLKEYINDEPEPVSAMGSNREDQMVYHNTIPADAQEVFFADQTADIRYQVTSPQNVAEATPEMEAFRENFSQEYVGAEPPKSMGQLVEDMGEEDTKEIPHVSIETRDVQEIRFEEETQEILPVAEGIVGAAVIANTENKVSAPPRSSAYESLLSQEADGQISLADIAEEKVVEKQITGQLNIQDILADWEKMKKENEQKMQEEVRQKVLEQTGQIFTQFDVSSKTGILASLEDPSVLDQYEEQVSPTVMKGIDNHAKQVILPDAQMQEPTEEAVEVLEATEIAEDVVEATEEISVVEELSEELIESVIEEDIEETVVDEASGDMTTPVEGTIVAQFTGDINLEPGYVEELSEDNLFIGTTKLPEEEIQDAVEDLEESTEVCEDAVEAEIAEVMTEEVVEEVEEEVAAEEEMPEESEEAPNFAATGEGNFYGSVTAAIPGSIWKEVDGVEESAENVSGKDNTAENEEAVTEEMAEEPVEEYNMQEQDDVVSEEEPQEEGHKDLTPEEKELFQPFLYSKKMKKQILDTLEKITLAAYVGNVAITSDSSESALQLAKLIVSYTRMYDDNFSGNVAKISATNLNKKDISNVFAKLVNGALLIEDAENLNNQTLRDILQGLNQETNGIIVILMDRKRKMDQLMSRASVVQDFFNARIDILSMNVDMLVNYGIRYVNEKGYCVDDMGRLALYKRVSEMQVGNHTVTIAEIRELMDGAVKHANRASLSKVASIIMRKRYDENDLVILKEKDFE